MNRFLHIFAVALLASLAAILSSCSMMHEDNDDCPTGLFVRFVYDYNTQRADMFKDHVGHVALYVYKESGELLDVWEVSNSTHDDALREYGYSLHIPQDKIEPGRYRIQAVCLQKDWNEALASPGAKYRRNTPAGHQDLVIALDHHPNRHPGHEHFDVSSEAPLDTLWHTLRVTAHEPVYGPQSKPVHATRPPYSVYPIEDQMVEIKKDYATYATVSLIRDTKHLNLTLRQLDNPTEINADDYEVAILYDNSHFAHDNEVIHTDSIHHSPYARWTTTYGDGGIEVENQGSRANSVIYQRTAHYNIMFNRLMYGNDPDKSAHLTLFNKKTGKLVADIDLPYILAQGRNAYDIFNYSPQEYLDRQHDYQLDFILRGDKWQTVVINVLSWSHRIQNEEL